MKRIVDAILALLHVALAAAADPDDRHAAGEFRQAFLQLLAVVVGRDLLELGLDLRASRLDRVVCSSAVDDHGLVLLDQYPLRLAEHGERDGFQLDPQLLGDHLCPGQRRQVVEHRPAPVAEPRRLHRGDLQAAAQRVDDQRRQHLALDILGDDQQRARGVHHRLQHRQQGVQPGQLLLVDQDVGIVEFDDHPFCVGDEVGAEIAAVELHALDHVKRGLHPLGLLDGDHALLADLAHRLCDHRADRRVAVGGDGADLGGFRLGGDRPRPSREFRHQRRDRLVDPALQLHRRHSRGHRLAAFADDRLRQHDRRGRAVAGILIGLDRDLAHHLRAHVLEAVGHFDFPGDGHPVLGDAGRAVAPVDQHSAAFRTERHPDRVGQPVDAAQHATARLVAEANLSGCHDVSPVGRAKPQRRGGRCVPAKRSSRNA